MTKRLTGKTVPLYAIKSPRGDILDFTIRSTKRRAVEEFDKAGGRLWEEAKLRGWKIIRVRFVEEPKA